MNFMNFKSSHKILYFSRNSMGFLKFQDFLMKNRKLTLPRATTRGGSPNHCNSKRNHRSQRGAIRPETTKTTQITFSALFRNFPFEINKIEEFLQIWVNLAKRRSLGGPAPRSLFSLRNIKVSEPPTSGKLARNCTIPKTSRILMKFSEVL